MRRLPAAVLSLCLPLGALASDAGTPAQVRITVRAIQASEGDGGIDPRLAPIQPHIQAFADQSKFRAFQLSEEQSFELDWKSPAQVELPGQRSLQVTPRTLAPDGRIKVHLELLGKHPAHDRKVHTDYSIPRGGTILIAGLDGGALIVAITQEVGK